MTVVKVARVTIREKNILSCMLTILVGDGRMGRSVGGSRISFGVDNGAAKKVVVDGQFDEGPAVAKRTRRDESETTKRRR